MDTSAAMHIDQPRAALGQTDADDPTAFNHCFAEVNGIRMHYIDEGQGPLVILLHGFPYVLVHVEAPDRGFGRVRLSGCRA